jgi:hypothetical protein
MYINTLSVKNSEKLYFKFGTVYKYNCALNNEMLFKEILCFKQTISFETILI